MDKEPTGEALMDESSKTVQSACSSSNLLSLARTQDEYKVI